MYSDPEGTLADLKLEYNLHWKYCSSERDDLYEIQDENGERVAAFEPDEDPLSAYLEGVYYGLKLSRERLEAQHDKLAAAANKRRRNWRESA